MEPDKELIQRSLENGPEFEPLVERHSQALHGYLARRSPDSADDLLSEVWLAAYAGRKTYDPSRGPVRAWLFGIARNVLANDLRRRYQVPLAPGVSDTENWDAVDDRIDAARVAPGLFAAVRSLPPHERELLLLVAIEGLTPSEAAAALGIPAATSRSRLYRARIHIQAHMSLDQGRHPLGTSDTRTNRSVTSPRGVPS